MYTKPNPYKIAWLCLMEVLNKKLPLEVWIAPIPEEHKKQMLEKGKRFIAKGEQK